MIVTLETELQNYILEQEIGRDELTIIYQGRRKSDDGPVAIKVIAPQFTFDDFFVRRFKDITRQTIRLEHPNIVRTYEVNQEGEAIYVVRDMIEARDCDFNAPCRKRPRAHTHNLIGYSIKQRHR